MIRLSVATLVALYAILNVFGEETRRPEAVARAEPLGLSLIQAAYIPGDETKDATVLPLPVSTISDEDAVQIALDAGAELRTERKRAPLRGFSKSGPAVEGAAADTDSAKLAAEPSYWTVTGNRVNLRSGPGTSNAVVGQLILGAEAEVLADKDGWYQVRTPDGGTSGWIFGKFLQPG